MKKHGKRKKCHCSAAERCDLCMPTTREKKLHRRKKRKKMKREDYDLERENQL